MTEIKDDETVEAMYKVHPIPRNTTDDIKESQLEQANMLRHLPTPEITKLLNYQDEVLSGIKQYLHCQSTIAELKSKEQEITTKIGDTIKCQKWKDVNNTNTIRVTYEDYQYTVDTLSRLNQNLELRKTGLTKSHTEYQQAYWDEVMQRDRALEILQIMHGLRDERNKNIGQVPKLGKGIAKSPADRKAELIEEIKQLQRNVANMKKLEQERERNGQTIEEFVTGKLADVKNEIEQTNAQLQAINEETTLVCALIADQNLQLDKQAVALRNIKGFKGVDHHPEFARVINENNNLQEKLNELMKEKDEVTEACQELQKSIDAEVKARDNLQNEQELRHKQIEGDTQDLKDQIKDEARQKREYEAKMRKLQEELRRREPFLATFKTRTEQAKKAHDAEMERLICVKAKLQALEEANKQLVAALHQPTQHALSFCKVRKM